MTGKGGKATRGATGMLENLQINVPEYSCTRVWVGEYMLPFLLGHMIDLYLTFFFEISTLSESGCHLSQSH